MPGKAKARSEEVDASLLVDGVFRLGRAVNRIGNLRLRPWNLTLSSYAALRVMADQPDLSLAQLSRRCFVRPQTMTRIVSELRNRGLVERGPSAESKRAMLLTLTEEGHRALEDMSAQVNKINESIGAVLSTDDVELLDAQLRRCAIEVERQTIIVENETARKPKA